MEKLENLEYYINEIPMFDEEFIINLLEFSHLINVTTDLEEFEASLKPLKRTLQLLCLNPYNAYKIIDAL